MIGVGAYLYIALHLVLYIFDQMFDLGKVASEIVLRYYLTIGFTGGLGRAVLAATSNNAMVRRLGGIRWRRLHWLGYPGASVGRVPYFMRPQPEGFGATVSAGGFLWP